MTIRFMKFIDEYVGRVLVIILAILTLAKRRTTESKAPKKILVIKFWGIGSVTLSTPFLVQIKKKWPTAEIHYLTLSSNEELCTLISEINSTHSVSLSSFTSLVKSIIRNLASLKHEHFDIVYDLEFFTNLSAIVASFCGANRRVGFVNSQRTMDFRRWLYSDRVEFDDTEHTARNFLHLIGSDEPIEFPIFHIRNTRRVVDLNRFSVVFNINAGPLAFERRWMPGEFKQLADYLIKEYKATIYLTGNREEREYVGVFARMFDEEKSVRNLCGELNISELIQLIRSCVLIVTNDSGPLHLASALNSPTIAIFGPETPRRYGSLSSRNLTLYMGLRCSPCMTVSNLKTVNCVNDRQCMKQIRFSNVKESIKRFVDSLPEREEEIAVEDFLFLKDGR